MAKEVLTVTFTARITVDVPFWLKCKYLWFVLRGVKDPAVALGDDLLKCVKIEIVEHAKL